MVYDPTLPEENADLVSAVMRSQFHGLHDLIRTLNRRRDDRKVGGLFCRQ